MAGEVESLAYTPCLLVCDGGSAHGTFTVQRDSTSSASAMLLDGNPWLHLNVADHSNDKHDLPKLRWVKVPLEACHRAECKTGEIYHTATYQLATDLQGWVDHYAIEFQDRRYRVTSREGSGWSWASQHSSNLQVQTERPTIGTEEASPAKRTKVERAPTSADQCIEPRDMLYKQDNMRKMVKRAQKIMAAKPEGTAR
ncbi:hypothetical protein Slin15195_G118050 [Septoria linicola]|uniref:Uncharacterized protein n=1 Tax=Septoria linicola TaxID=215465 RepID=A0A9Q9EP63_9PEZI|nr:hypothetical protein Slin14017_G095050 [Septoria linicola]USW58486.1 hypothetical protein Slin15195_G118050 [Septoria linicola]